MSINQILADRWRKQADEYRAEADVLKQIMHHYSITYGEHINALIGGAAALRMQAREYEKWASDAAQLKLKEAA